MRPRKALVSGLMQRPRVVAAVVIGALLCLAWSQRFIQDDAFISFRYADNLVRGHGLVWNPGERGVEGYSNFLWTLLMSAGLYVGIEPVLFSYLLGMLFYLCSLVFTYGVAQLLLNNRNGALLSIVLLGTNYTFLSYATGGLETQMQAALCIAGLYAFLRIVIAGNWTAKSCIALSCVLALAVLTRLDSMLLCIFLFPFALIMLWLAPAPTWKKLNPLLGLLGPFILIIVVWFAWKLWYYGDILPNSYYLKVSSNTSVYRGFRYLYLFLRSYLLFPVLIVAIVGLPRAWRDRQRHAAPLFLFVAAWLAYVVRIGGDFMEFRFLVPILTLTFVGVAWLVVRYLRWSVLRWALVGLIVAGSLHHAYRFSYTLEDGVEPIRDLGDHLTSRQQNWIGVGKVLGGLFHEGSGVTIATTAAGAVPYFSRLRTVDMYGVNDGWVARNGELLTTVPGHQRLAQYKYLIDQRVNLIIGHPQVLEKSAPVDQFPLVAFNEGDDASQLRTLEIPLDSAYKVVVLYATRSPFIDKVIADNRLNLLPAAWGP